MKYLFFIAAFFIGSVSANDNQVTICKSGDSQRKIEVAYLQGSATICEVQYSKESEMKVLWSASSDRQYCQEKATAFIEKQRGWGWMCETEENNHSVEAVSVDTTSDSVAPMEVEEQAEESAAE